MKQVWINLLSNAIKFTSRREQAIIRISCHHEGSKQVFCIQDNGVGFEQKYVDKLFGVFQRLHREKDFEGIGVGLAIVQRIILRHGGEVWAEGIVDEGASIHYSLPLSVLSDH
jgi:light-regulated signal transduction histidine kinase (bacteriophytochrome)